MSWPSAAPGHCPPQASRVDPNITLPIPAMRDGELQTAALVSGAVGRAGGVGQGGDLSPL